MAKIKDEPPIYEGSSYKVKLNAKRALGQFGSMIRFYAIDLKA
jgi:hypothetical protein